MMACPLHVPSTSTTYRWRNVIGLGRHSVVCRSRDGLKYVGCFLSHAALKAKKLADRALRQMAAERDTERPLVNATALARYDSVSTSFERGSITKNERRELRKQVLRSRRSAS